MIHQEQINKPGRRTTARTTRAARLYRGVGAIRGPGDTRAARFLHDRQSLLLRSVLYWSVRTVTSLPTTRTCHQRFF